MYVVKRKYIIKFFALILILFVLIGGIFLQNELYEKNTVKSEYIKSKAFFNNLFASSKLLEGQVEKLGVSDENKSISKEIYGQILLIKNHIYSGGYPFSYALEWLSGLEAYAETDMADTQKNTQILEQLKSINKDLLSQCDVFKFPDSLDIANKAFAPFLPSDAAPVRESKDQYSMLQNRLTAERKDITEFAKEILNSPLSPSRFKGNQLSKDALSFYGINSYATVFSAGKILEKMATTSGKHPSKSFSSPLEAADWYFKTYAHFAPACRLIFSIDQTDALYCIYCPVISTPEGDIFNYDEQIRLGVSKTDLALIAFDAENYLKKHKTNEPEPIVPIFPAVGFEEKRYVILDGAVFTEGVIKKNDEFFYFLVSPEGKKEIFSKNEYMNHLFSE